MTPEEFNAWLDGYLEGKSKVDTGVIKAKMKEVVAPMTLVPWTRPVYPSIEPYTSPYRPYPYDFWPTSCDASDSVETRGGLLM